jgi:rhodanese-related sulfurtransferase
MIAENIKTIGIGHLKRLLDSGEKIRLIDVRSMEDFKKEHIKGAESIPLDEIGSKVPGLLKPDENIITYCDSFVCHASTGGAQQLIKMGYKNVKDYKGGLREWKTAGNPTESG